MNETHYPDHDHQVIIKKNLIVGNVSLLKHVYAKSLRGDMYMTVANLAIDMYSFLYNYSQTSAFFGTKRHYITLLPQNQ